MTRRLNRKLVLEEAQRTADGGGGFRSDWVSVGVLWAEITPGTGTERDGEALTLATVPYRIVVRGAPVGSPRRPQPDQRLRDGARIFRILSVAEADPGQRYLVCFAREEVTA